MSKSVMVVLDVEGVLKEHEVDIAEDVTTNRAFLDAVSRTFDGIYLSDDCVICIHGLGKADISTIDDGDTVQISVPTKEISVPTNKISVPSVFDTPPAEIASSVSFVDLDQQATSAPSAPDEHEPELHEDIIAAANEHSFVDQTHEQSLPPQNDVQDPANGTPGLGDSFAEVTAPQLVYRTRNPFNRCELPLLDAPTSSAAKAVLPELVKAGLLPAEVQSIGIQRIDPALEFISDATDNRLKQLGVSFMMRSEDFQTAYGNNEHVLVRPRSTLELFVHCFVQDDDGTMSYGGHPRSVFLPTTSDVSVLQYAVARLQKAPHVLKHLCLVPDNMLQHGRLEGQPVQQLESLRALVACPPAASHVSAVFEIQDEFELVVEGTRVFQPNPPTTDKGDKLIPVNRREHRTLADVHDLLQAHSPFPSESKCRIFDPRQRTVEIDESSFSNLTWSAEQTRVLIARADSFVPVLLRDAATQQTYPFCLQVHSWDGILEQIRMVLEIPDEKELEIFLSVSARHHPVSKCAEIRPGDELMIKVKAQAGLQNSVPSTTPAAIPVATPISRTDVSGSSTSRTAIQHSTSSRSAPADRPSISIVIEGTRLLKLSVTTNEEGDQIITVDRQVIHTPADVRVALRRQSVFMPEALYEFRTEDGKFLDDEALHQLLRQSTGRLTLRARAPSCKIVVLVDEITHQRRLCVVDVKATWDANLREISQVLSIPESNAVDVFVHAARGGKDFIVSADMVLDGEELHVRHRSPETPTKRAPQNATPATPGSAHKLHNRSPSAKHPIVNLPFGVEGINQPPINVAINLSPASNWFNMIQDQVGLATMEGVKLVWQPFNDEDWVAIKLLDLDKLAQGTLKHPRTEAPARDVPKCQIRPTDVHRYFVPIHFNNHERVLIYLVEPLGSWDALLDACRRHWHLPDNTILSVHKREEPQVELKYLSALLRGEPVLVKTASSSVSTTLPPAPSPINAQTSPISKPVATETKQPEPQPTRTDLVEIDPNLDDFQQQIFRALRDMDFQHVTADHAKRLSGFFNTIDGAIEYAMMHWDELTRQVQGTDVSETRVPSASPSRAISSPTVLHTPQAQYQRTAAVEAPTRRPEVAQAPVQLTTLMREKPHLANMIQKIIDTGLYQSYSLDDILRGLKRCSSIEALVEFLLNDSAAPPASRSFRCDVCFDDVPINEIYTISCIHSHRFCVGCLFENLKADLNKGQPVIPACPYNNQPGPGGSEPCHFLIPTAEAEQIVDLHCHQQLGTPGMRGVMDEGRRILETLANLWLVKGYRDGGCIRCPNCEGNNADGFWFIPPNDSMKVTCPRCAAEFCSHCSRIPYHYDIPCDDVVQVNHDWLQWLQQGRQEYVQAVARQNAQYQQLLTEYQQKVQEHQNEERAAAARYQELMNDEQYKAQNCKRCPRCRRVIDKLTGCDAMVCGTDAHGGNVQNGCGHRFNWSQAPQYTAETGNRRAVAFNEAQPEEVAQVQHMIAEGEPVPCDVCHGPIVGPLLRCVNCPAFVMCLTCHMQAHQHAENHIFQIVTEAQGRH